MKATNVVEAPVDFVLVTALEDERTALLAKLPDCQPLPPGPQDIRRYYSGRLPVTLPRGVAGHYSIVVMQLLGMGRVQAATATSDAIRHWRPRYVIMVGIAGGVAAKGAQLGDILVSQQVVDYELQMLTTEGPEIRWQVHQVDQLLLGASQLLPAAAALPLITARRPLKATPQRLIGPIASGDKVIAYGAALKQYRQHWAALIGVEMEAAGVATATFQSAKPPGFFMVRGVSDLADAGKDSKTVRKWRPYACDVAAAYTIALLQSGPVPLRTCRGAKAKRKNLATQPALCEADVARHTYLKNLRRHCLALPLTSLGDDDDCETTLTLDDVYIDLETTTEIPLSPGQAKMRQEGAFRGERTRRLSAIEAAARQKRLVLLGAPGSGKSTFVQRLLARLASRQLGELPQAIPGIPDNLLPILIVLRDLTPCLTGLNPDDWPEQERREKLSVLIRELAEQNLHRLQAVGLAAALRVAFDSGKILLVLDGLDEVPLGLQKVFRQTIAAALAQFRPERVIVTCRIRSYQGDGRLAQFQAHTLSPFTEEQIKRFVRGWYAAQQRHSRLNAEQAKDKASDLTGAALSGELRELAENPMLLTTMTLIHQREAKLPNQRVQLYTLAVDVLVRRWQKGKTGEIASFLNDNLRVRAALERLAHEAHQAGKGEPNLADLPRGTALTFLELPEYLGSAALASDFLDHVDQRAGLLVGRGGEPGHPQSYSFPHRTFQEYLAGCHLLSGRDSGAVAWAFCERAGDGESWSLAAKLAAEELCYNVRDGRTRLLDLAYHLCPCQAPASTRDRRADLWSAYVASLLGADFIRRDHGARDGGKNYLERLVPRLVTLLGSDLTAPERAEAGRILAQLGDPRRGVGLATDNQPDLDWIEIAPGSFVMGSKEGDGYSDEQPQFTCRLIRQPYRLSRFPITVAQYSGFVYDGGYGEKRYWTEAGWRWRMQAKVEGPEDYGAQFETTNHPRVGVSWFEAVAFCRWLSEQTQHDIRLPSEAEWERAARHTDARAYPWGSEEDCAQRCNMAETGISSTSAVGIFPNGNSQCGAADMAGNVWEWCRTKWTDDYENYEQSVDDDPDGDSPRVLRGGSFDDSPVSLRCSCRLYGRPGGRVSYLGFRVVCVGASAR